MVQYSKILTKERRVTPEQVTMSQVSKTKDGSADMKHDHGSTRRSPRFGVGELVGISYPSKASEASLVETLRRINPSDECTTLLPATLSGISFEGTLWVKCGIPPPPIICHTPPG